MAKPSEKRSSIMRAVRSKDTSPELVIRKWLHASGYRYRLHRKDLPGKPDIVFLGRRKIIFVHGCFWHGHDCPRGDRQPKTNSAYWKRKIEGNVARDQTQIQTLGADGWTVLVIWECETKGKKFQGLTDRIRGFLEEKQISKVGNKHE